MSQIYNYEEVAQRHNAAYAAFQSIYISKNPPPVKTNAGRDVVSLIIVLALLVVMVASIVVSSSRTIVEFGGDAIGTMAFIMLEGGLVAYAFFRARRNASASKIEDARQLATLGLVLAFVSAIGANIDNVLKTHGLSIPSEVNMVINLLVAVSAPTLAFISSDVLALELMAGEIKRRQAQATFDEKYQEWKEGMNRAWASQQGRWGVKIEIANEPNSLPIHSVNSLNGANEQPQLPPIVNSSTGYTKRMDARSLVHEFFKQHPDRLNSRLDELVIQIEQETGVRVGRTSIHNVRREIVGGNQ